MVIERKYNLTFDLIRTISEAMCHGTTNDIKPLRSSTLHTTNLTL